MHTQLVQSIWRVLRCLPPTTAFTGSVRGYQCTKTTITSPTCFGLWRSFFYVPGDRPNMMKKMADSHVKLETSQFVTHIPDLVVLDCEDAVGLDRKAIARQNVAAAFMDSNGGQFKILRENLRRTVIVRTNAVDSIHAATDVDTVLLAAIQSTEISGGQWPGPDMFCLPKVESVEELSWLAYKIDSMLTQSSIPRPSLSIIAMIESCNAVVNLATICADAKKLKIPLLGLVFGSDDYCVSLGVDRSSSNIELAYARQYIPVVARAFGLYSIDMVDIDFKDTDNLQKNCQLGVKLGFSGKQTIHPAQLPTVNSSYSPSAARIEWSKALLEEARKLSSNGDLVGVGAFNFRGQMIDRPTLKQAEHIVSLSSMMNLRT